MEQERLPTAASREEKGRWGRVVNLCTEQRLALRSRETSRGVRGGIWPTDPFFKKEHALQEKAWFTITPFTAAPPLSITTFRRGFLRARHTEQSGVLLCMAHPGMEPLWAAECIFIPSH